MKSVIHKADDIEQVREGQILENLATLTDFRAGKARLIDVLGVHRDHVMKIFSGKRSFTRPMMYQLERSLGIPPGDWFLSASQFRRKHGSKLRRAFQR